MLIINNLLFINFSVIWQTILAIRKFNTKYAKTIEEVKKAGRKFIGTLTKVPKINTKKLDKKVKLSLNKYLKRMKSNID